jgi:glycine oxidase
LAKHVLIVGAGIAGLASAWELARSGLRVTLLERRQTGQESSWAGAGILSALLPWDYRRPVNRLIQASLAHYPAWIDALRQVATTDPEYRQTGMLVLPPFDAEAADRWLKRPGARSRQTARGDRRGACPAPPPAYGFPMSPRCATRAS